MRSVSTIMILLLFTTESFAQTEAVSGQLQFNITGTYMKGLDNNPPSIEIFKTALQQDKVSTINEKKILIKGFVHDSSGIRKVLINGAEIDYNQDGVFNYDLPLEYGKNLFVISATDNHNNTRIARYYIYRRSEQEVSDLSSQFGENYALIIGVEQYDDPNIGSLDNPIKDAYELKTALVSYYTFEESNISILEDPDKYAIIKKLTELRKVLQPNSNLLIFYAGHGLWDEEMQVGNWLPKDATLDNPINWISNTELRNYIRAIHSNHILLISDACFSGSIFKVREVSTMPPPSISELNRMPSRKVITSGTMNTVPDKSVFVEYLIKRLEENQKQFLTAEELFSSIRMAVINNSPNYQVPQYGAIYDAGDQGGDFIFIKK